MYFSKVIQKAVVGRRQIQESNVIPLALIASVSEIALYVQVLGGFPPYAHYLVIRGSLAIHELYTP